MLLWCLLSSRYWTCGPDVRSTNIKTLGLARSGGSVSVMKCEYSLPRPDVSAAKAAIVKLKPLAVVANSLLSDGVRYGGPPIGLSWSSCSPTELPEWGPWGRFVGLLSFGVAVSPESLLLSSWLFVLHKSSIGSDLMLLSLHLGVPEGGDGLMGEFSRFVLLMPERYKDCKYSFTCIRYGGTGES